MPRFRYAAVAVNGAESRGKIKASSAASARGVLADRGLTVFEIRQRKKLRSLEITRKRVPRQDIMHFSRQAAAFIRAGIPILDAIAAIAEEVSNPTLRKVLENISVSLASGESFSGAVATQGSTFPAFYVDMLRAAEVTGRLDTVLDQLAIYIERDVEARRRVKSALAYPAIIMMMSVVTVVILAAFVLPRFKKFFKSLDATLPLPTRMLLSVSGWLGQWYWAVLTGIAVAVLLGLLLVRTSFGRRMWDGLILRMPITGDVVRFAIVERFCRILGSMVQAGVPLPDAMAIVSEGTRNVVYERALDRVRDSMLEGEGLSRPIARSQLFPGAVTQMVRVGEETGTLDQQLETAAQFYDSELTYKIKRLTTFFEPAVIVVMGLVVGFVAVALVSAMYGVFQQTGKV